MSKQSEVVKVPFYGQEITAFFDGKAVYVGVRQVCDNLGISFSSQSTKIKSHRAISKGVQLIVTPSYGGPQQKLALDIEFLPLWLATINPSKVAEFVQDRLVNYQLEAKEVLAAHFFGNPQTQVIPKTPAELMLQQAQLIVDQERRTAALETKTARIEATIQKHEQEREEAREQLMLLPAPFSEVPSIPIRKRISQRMNRHYLCDDTMTRSEMWRHLFSQFKLRYGIDLKIRSENKTAKEKAAGKRKWKYEPLDIAEELGKLQDLYDLSCSLFK